MKRTLPMTIASAFIASTLLVAFQNCSSGGLPDLQTSSSSSVAGSGTTTPVQLFADYSSSMLTNAVQTITATNALGTPSFVLSSGTACSVNALGVVTAAAAVPANPVCTILVSDSGGNLPLTVSITVSAATQVPSYTTGTQTFDLSSATQFTVPAFATSLKVEVYGAGGGGGDYAWGKGAPAGLNGGLSSVIVGSVTLTANGGSGGGQGTLFVNGFVPGGAGGSASGGTTNSSGAQGLNGRGGNAAGPNGGAGGAAQAAGAIPGGGGGAVISSDNYGNQVGSAGPGGGGGYTVRSFAQSEVAAGTTLTISIGAGGAGGSGFSGYTVGGNGADGRVVITWQ